MKLLTETKDGCLMVDDVFIDHDNIEWYQAGKVSHDAMAAHALMQAMVEWEANLCLGGIDWVRKRADEIMAGWTGAGE